MRVDVETVERAGVVEDVDGKERWNRRSCETMSQISTWQTSGGDGEVLAGVLVEQEMRRRWGEERVFQDSGFEVSCWKVEVEEVGGMASL